MIRTAARSAASGSASRSSRAWGCKQCQCLASCRAQHRGRLRNGLVSLAGPDADGGRVRERDGDVGGVVTEGGVGGAVAQQGEIAGFVESASVRGPGPRASLGWRCRVRVLPGSARGLRCWRARGWPSVRRSRGVGRHRGGVRRAASRCGGQDLRRRRRSRDGPCRGGLGRRARRSSGVLLRGWGWGDGDVAAGQSVPPLGLTGLRWEWSQDLCQQSRFCVLRRSPEVGRAAWRDDVSGLHSVSSWALRSSAVSAGVSLTTVSRLRCSSRTSS